MFRSRLTRWGVVPVAGGTVRILAFALAFLLASYVLIDGSEAEVGAKAGLSLVTSDAEFTQKSAVLWTLDKTGYIDKASAKVVWEVTATEQGTTADHLIVTGVMRVHNAGAGGATIGNIVVNLQTRFGNKWVTESSDIADATYDDAAISANISPTASSEGLGTFTENAASGQLLFMDASTNSLFALVPQQLSRGKRCSQTARRRVADTDRDFAVWPGPAPASALIST